MRETSSNTSCGERVTSSIVWAAAGTDDGHVMMLHSVSAMSARKTSSIYVNMNHISFKATNVCTF